LVSLRNWLAITLEIHQGTEVLVTLTAASVLGYGFRRVLDLPATKMSSYLRKLLLSVCVFALRFVVLPRPENTYEPLIGAAAGTVFIYNRIAKKFKL